MAYTPLNVLVYSAAFSGAMAAICEPAGAAVLDPVTGDYAAQASIAAAWAQAVDTAWTNSPANSYDTDAIKFMSLEFFGGHGTGPLSPIGTLATQSNWTVFAVACVAAVRQGDTNFASQGITPPGNGNSNRAEGSGTATTAGQATITVVAAMKLIAKSSGIFKAGFSLSWALAAADVATMTVKVFTDAVAGTPLTLANAGSIGFGSSGVAQPGNIAVATNGAFTANAGAGIVPAGASAGFTTHTTSFTQGTGATGALFDWDGVVGLALPTALAENPIAIGTSCLITLSLTNSVAARATGNISCHMFEL